MLTSTSWNSRWRLPMTVLEGIRISSVTFGTRLTINCRALGTAGFHRISRTVQKFSAARDILRKRIFNSTPPFNRTARPGYINTVPYVFPIEKIRPRQANCISKGGRVCFETSAPLLPPAATIRWVHWLPASPRGIPWIRRRGLGPMSPTTLKELDSFEDRKRPSKIHVKHQSFWRLIGVLENYPDLSKIKSETLGAFRGFESNLYTIVRIFLIDVSVGYFASLELWYSASACIRDVRDFMAICWRFCKKTAFNFLSN